MPGADRDGRESIQKAVQDARRALGEPLPCARLEPLTAARVRVGPPHGQPRDDADGPDAGEHGDVMPVHLVFERALADLIQAGKLQGHPSPIGEDEAVKPDGEAFLILAGDGRRGSDDARAARDHHPLPVSGVERHGHGREDRAGKVAVELVHQDGLEKRALIDPLPSWRVVGRADDGGTERVALGDTGAVRGPKGGRVRGLDRLSPHREQAPRVELRPGGLLSIEGGEGGHGVEQAHGRRRSRSTRAGVGAGQGRRVVGGLAAAVAAAGASPPVSGRR